MVFFILLVLYLIIAPVSAVFLLLVAKMSRGNFMDAYSILPASFLWPVVFIFGVCELCAIIVRRVHDNIKPDYDRLTDKLEEWIERQEHD